MPNIIDRNSVEVNSFIDFYFDNQLNFKEIEQNEKYCINYAEDFEYKYYLLCDSDNVRLSVIRFKINVVIGKNQYFQINKSYSWERDKGHGLYLYKYSIKHIGSSILSDKLQSRPGSFNIWKKLIKDDEFDVKVININNKRILGIKSDYDEYDIWGAFEHQIESIKQIPFESVFDETTDVFVNNSELLYDESFSQINVSEDIINYIRRGHEKKSKIRNRENILLIVDNKK